VVAAVFLTNDGAEVATGGDGQRNGSSGDALWYSAKGVKNRDDPSDDEEETMSRRLPVLRTLRRYEEDSTAWCTPRRTTNGSDDVIGLVSKDMIYRYEERVCVCDGKGI